VAQETFPDLKESDLFKKMAKKHRTTIPNTFSLALFMKMTEKPDWMRFLQM
jgi:hypothetical protein